MAGLRVDYQFERKILDFDHNKMVVIGHYDESEELSTREFPFTTVHRSSRRIRIRVADGKDSWTETFSRTSDPCLVRHKPEGYDEFYCTAD
jgi:hypothetical protein